MYQFNDFYRIICFPRDAHRERGGGLGKLRIAEAQAFGREHKAHTTAVYINASTLLYAEVANNL